MANIAIPALLQDIESEEELDDIPADEKEADPLRHARIKRLIDGTEFIGEVEDIECGRVSRERVYRVRYPDGDLEHMTLEQLREVLLEEEPKKVSAPWPGSGEVAVPSVSAGATGKEQEPEAAQRPEKRPLTKKADQEQESEVEQPPVKKQLTTKAEQKQEPEAEQRPEKKPPAKKAESKAGDPLPKGGQAQGAARSNAKDSAPRGGQGQGSAKAKAKVKSTAADEAKAKAKAKVKSTAADEAKAKAKAKAKANAKKPSGK